jgi:hypothetical protein
VECRRRRCWRRWRWWRRPGSARCSGSTRSPGNNRTAVNSKVWRSSMVAPLARLLAAREVPGTWPGTLGGLFSEQYRWGKTESSNI